MYYYLGKVGLLGTLCLVICCFTIPQSLIKKKDKIKWRPVEKPQDPTEVVSVPQYNYSGEKIGHWLDL